MKFFKYFILLATISLLAFIENSCATKSVFVTNYSAEPISVYHASSAGQDSKDYGWTTVANFEQKITIPQGTVEGGKPSSDTIKQRTKELKIGYDSAGNHKIIVINEQKQSKSEFSIPDKTGPVYLSYYSKDVPPSRKAGLQESRRSFR